MNQIELIYLLSKDDFYSGEINAESINVTLLTLQEPLKAPCNTAPPVVSQNKFYRLSEINF